MCEDDTNNKHFLNNTHLNIKRGKVLRDHSCGMEQVIGELFVEHLLGLLELGRHAEQTAQKRIQTALVEVALRCEKRVAQRQVTAARVERRLEARVQAIGERLDESVTEAEGGRGELVAYAGVDALVVAGVGAEHAHAALAKYVRQPVLERDQLHLSGDDLARLLVEPLAAPCHAIVARQLLDKTIVLTHPHVVHGQQAKLLVGSIVAGRETAHLYLRSSCLHALQLNYIRNERKDVRLEWCFRVDSPCSCRG